MQECGSLCIQAFTKGSFTQGVFHASEVRVESDRGQNAQLLHERGFSARLCCSSPVGYCTTEPSSNEFCAGQVVQLMPSCEFLQPHWYQDLLRAGSAYSTEDVGGMGSCGLSTFSL